jgi:hypothetical protein
VKLLAALAAALLMGTGAARAQFGGDIDVPFITTPDRVTLAMLALAGVGATDRLIDLGSGDGRIVITAARRFGARGLGVEIVPDLVAQSLDNARRAGVAALVDFRVQDLFATPLQDASVITLYLLPEVNLQLRPRLLALAPGTRIVSHDWDMSDWPADRMLTLDVPEKAIGRDKRSRLMLWVVPARLQGLWCGPGGVALRIVQRYQQVTATLDAPGSPATTLGLVGRIDGARLRLLGAGSAPGISADLQPDGSLQLGNGAAPASRLQPAGAAAVCPAGD